MTLDFARIRGVLNPAHFADCLVLGVGCGSGNSIVLSELVKCGVSRLALWDPDTLGPENLVRHLLGRADLGRNKAEAMRDWILDRNPSAEVIATKGRFQDGDSFEAALADARYRRKLILCGLDDHHARLELNTRAALARAPMALGMVYRGGVGGMSFLYQPRAGGCFSCVDSFAQARGLLFSTLGTEPTLRGEEEIYGLSLPRFVKNPGLGISIGFVALIVARLALDVLVEGSETTLRPMPSNLIVFAAQPDPMVGRKHFDTTHFKILAQEGCTICWAA